MSNQDIKGSIAPSDTQSSEAESDSDSNKDLWAIASRKTTALDIIAEMTGNPYAAVALVEDLIAKKYKFKMDHGREITCRRDWMQINIPIDAKVQRGKGKGQSNKKSPKSKGDCKSPPKSPPKLPPKLPPNAPRSSQNYRERREFCNRKTPKQTNRADDQVAKITIQKSAEEEDECSAPVRAAIINSCQDANSEEADAIQAANQATYQEAEDNKKEETETDDVKMTIS